MYFLDIYKFFPLCRVWAVTTRASTLHSFGLCRAYVLGFGFDPNRNYFML
jgi:hypothetical protein